MNKKTLIFLIIAISAITSLNVSAMENQTDCMLELDVSFDLFLGACKNGDTQKVQILFENGREKFANCFDNYDNTPLSYACWKNNLKIVKLLLPDSTPETINKPDRWCKTPLSWACFHNNLEIVKLLLPQCTKETINQPDKYGETPLCLACFHNNLEIIKLLLPHCTKETINKPDQFGNTPLYWACLHNNLEIVKLLLPQCTKETINQPDKCERPLYWACFHNNLEIVKLLLPQCTKETINKTNQDGETPLYRACFHNNLEIVQLLLPHCTKETINQPHKRGITPLSWACKENNLEIIQLLIENGATVEENDIQKTRNDQTRIYLQHAYNFQQAENQLAFIKNFINENQNEQEIKAMVRLAFCVSLRQMLEHNLEIEMALFSQINEMAQSDFTFAEAILQALNIEPEESNLLRKEKIIDFVDHVIKTVDPCFMKTREMQERLENYRDLRDFLERYKFVAAQEIGNRAVIETNDREIRIPKSLFCQL